MYRLFVVFAFLFGIVLPATAQPGIEKIDTALMKKIGSGASAEFLVILQEQTNVRDAARFRRKEDKGRYVYATLLETAERTQGPVRDVLRQAGAPMLWKRPKTEVFLRCMRSSRV